MATEILRPNAPGDECNINSQQYCSACPNHYTCIYVVDDGTRVNNYAEDNNWQRDLYSLPNHSEGNGTINSVKVYIRAWTVAAYPDKPSYARTALKTHGVAYDGDEHSIPSTGVWTNYSQTYTTNPNTRESWTWAEIDALQIGVSLKAYAVSPIYKDCMCSQVYIEVDYTPALTPTVSTVSATLIEEITANPRGNVTDIGTENPTRYIDYGTSSGSYTSSKDCGVGGTGVYDSNLTGLSPGTKYYYRARAVNSAGTGLGSELTFTTKPNPPTSLAATPVSSSQINLTWTKGTGAEKTYIRGKKGSYPADRADGYEVYNGTGTSCSDTALEIKSAYYYRAWSYKTGAPNSGYSDDYDQASATTLAGIPIVTAQPATSVEVITARLNGEVTDNGGENPTVHIYWGTSDGESTPGNWDHDENLGVKAVGTFYKDISGLTRGTKYYYRCYAENSAGGSWSSAVEFTTLLEKPVAAANAATGVGVSATTLNGTVTDDGGESCQYRFRYKKAGGDYAYTAWTGAKATGETFSEGISGLDASSAYYFNAQVKNSEFESDWSAEQTFNTGAVVVAPTGTTDPATLAADIEATLNGTVTSDGGEACEVRFQYGLTAAYGTNTAWQPRKLTSNSFSQRIYGLTPNTEYHFRAQIKNSAGTANGVDRTFTTLYFPTPFLRRVLRDVFGSGADISAANPLQVYDPQVDTKVDELLNSTLVLTETGGTVTTTGPGTEDVVYINDDPQGEYKPEKVVIDFSNQTVDETVVARLYYRIKEGGAYIKEDSETFIGVQDPALINIELEPNRFGIKVTIERSAGAAKVYDWEAHYKS